MAWHYASSDPTGHQPLVVLNELRGAAIERYFAVTSYTSNLSLLVPGIQLPHGWYSWVEQLEDLVYWLIAKFVNHTDHDGNWDSLPWGEPWPYPPMWSQSTMLTHLGETRMATPMTDRELAAWAGQLWRILNLLRWTSTRVSVPTGFSRSSGAWTTWEQAVSNWNAASWEAEPSVAGRYLRGEGDDYRFDAYAGDVTPRSHFGIVDWDLYAAFFERQNNSGDWDYVHDPSVYYNPDYPEHPATLNRRLASGVQASPGQVVQRLGNMPSSWDIPKPAVDTTNGYGYVTKYMGFILKHDPYFTFIDRGES